MGSSSVAASIFALKSDHPPGDEHFLEPKNLHPLEDETILVLKWSHIRDMVPFWSKNTFILQVMNPFSS